MSKINRWIYIILNLSWVAILSLSLPKLFLTVENPTHMVNSLIILALISMQIYAWIKLRKGTIIPAVFACILLLFALDAQGLKFIPYGIINFFIEVSSSNVEFKFFITDPNITVNTSIGNADFKSLGFNLLYILESSLLLYEYSNTKKQQSDLV